MMIVNNFMATNGDSCSLLATYWHAAINSEESL